MLLYRDLSSPQGKASMHNAPVKPPAGCIIRQLIQCLSISDGFVLDDVLSFEEVDLTYSFLTSAHVSLLFFHSIAIVRTTLAFFIP